MTAVCQDVHGLRAAKATLREIAQLTGLSVSGVHKRLQPKPAKPPKAKKVQAPQVVPEPAPPCPAETAKPETRRKLLTQRTCMCCAKPFKSEGPHNRLCRACRTRNVSPFAPAL